MSDRGDGASTVSALGRRRIYGVDFSGAQDAGAGIWLASATHRDGDLVVEGSFSGVALPDSGCDRDACLPALRAFLAGADDPVVGVDVPFGLPAELVEADSWRTFLAGFPGDATDPESWAERCRERAEGLEDADDLVERKRATDEAVDASFSPYNLRMRSATFYWLRDVLGPLVDADAVSALPMQPPDPGRPWMVETYPAAVLDRLDVDATGYKGEDGDAGRRAAILDALEETGVTVTPGVQTDAEADADGDALDAVLAAVGVAWSLEEGAPLSPGTVDARTRLEGQIYA